MEEQKFVRNKYVALWCTQTERQAIHKWARALGFRSVSDFLRHLAFTVIQRAKQRAQQNDNSVELF